MKKIELPRKVIVGDGAISMVKEVANDLRLRGRSLVVSGKNTRNTAGDAVCQQLGSEIYIVSDSSDDEINAIKDLVKDKEVRYAVAVGGGRVIDTAKVASYESEIPFISVPTAASHDGIASPCSSLGKGTHPNVFHCPMAVIADTTIIKNAPPRLLASGCADVISNYTAVLDWKLAYNERLEYYGDYAATLSAMSAEIVMQKSAEIRQDVKILVEALISSGVAIGIAGSSRPSSGSEHMFSHALDRICKKPALHGEQCGVGCIMMAYLHQAEWTRVRDALKRVNAPTNAIELGIPDADIIDALTVAHTIRDRYTILRNGLSRQDAENLAKNTGVIV